MGNDARVDRGLDFDRESVQRVDRAEIESGSGGGSNLLTRPAERFKERQP